MKRGVSDATLMALWRKAVLKRYGSRCVICGAGPDGLDCNHIIKRRVRCLRYDPLNGVPVCHARPAPEGRGESCHQWAESLAGLDCLRDTVGEVVWGYLKARQNLVLKVYLTEESLSPNVWRRRVKAALLAELEEV